MSEQKKKNGLKGFLKRKQLRYGSYAIAMTLLVVAAIVLVNIAVKAAEDNWVLRLDLSYNSITRFSDTTKNALKELDKDVKFYVMATPGQENAQLMEVLDHYRAQSDRVTVQVIDPDKNPGVVNKFRGEGSTTTLSNNTVVVANGDETRYKVYSYYDMVNISYNQNTQQSYITSYKYEQVLTQGMLYASAEKTPTAYFMQGHGEPSLAPMATLQTMLESNNYDTAELAQGADMPDPDGNILVVIAPQKDLEERDREKVRAFAENGGGFLFVWDVATPDLPNFNSILGYYNIGYDKGMVIADINDYAQYYYNPAYVLAELGEHDITTPLTEGGKNLVLSMQSRAIAMPEMSKNECEITPLLRSKTGSFLADITNTTRADWTRQADEPEGPLTMAAAVLRHNFADAAKSGRAVLIGSVYSITDATVLNSFNNGEFVLSAVKWAAKDDAVNLSIISKTANRGSLQIASQNEMYILAALSIVVLPLVILVFGIVVWLRRRHL